MESNGLYIVFRKNRLKVIAAVELPEPDVEHVEGNQLLDGVAVLRHPSIVFATSDSTSH